MQNRTPTARPILDFTPVPRKYRVDGWTPDRQRAFIVKLAETGSVKAAARAINMSPEGAYYLRRQPGGESFAAAWEAAVNHGVQNLADIAMERAVNGVSVPVYWKGEQVGEKRWYNDRLLMFMLRHHLPEKFGDLKQLPGAPSAAEAKALADTRATAAADPESLEAEALAEAEQTLEELMRLYRAKIKAERHYRLTGNIVAADFALRQMTHLELVMELGEVDIDGMVLINRARESDGDGQRFSSAWSEHLDEERRQAWAEMAEPERPPLAFPTNFLSIDEPMGAHAKDRSAARAEAKRLLAAGQALWEATGTEEGWLRWKSG